ncbi:hypothetical protein N7522_010887 [Penicillium canescens]|nr:hypothetical protein N7522_010887 [Penicillium canescens]
MVFAWLKTFFTSPSEEKQPQSSKRETRSHGRSHSKKVRDRERELRREWTGQKGDWNKFQSKGGAFVGGLI